MDVLKSSAFLPYPVNSSFMGCRLDWLVTSNTLLPIVLLLIGSWSEMSDFGVATFFCVCMSYRMCISFIIRSLLNSFITIKTRNK